MAIATSAATSRFASRTKQAPIRGADAVRAVSAMAMAHVSMRRTDWSLSIGVQTPASIAAMGIAAALQIASAAAMGIVASATGATNSGRAFPIAASTPRFAAADASHAMRAVDIALTTTLSVARVMPTAVRVACRVFAATTMTCAETAPAASRGSASSIATRVGPPGAVRDRGIAATSGAGRMGHAPARRIRIFASVRAGSAWRMNRVGTSA